MSQNSFMNFLNIAAVIVTLFTVIPMSYQFYKWYKKPNKKFEKLGSNYETCQKFFDNGYFCKKHPFEVEVFYSAIFGKSMSYSEIMYCLSKPSPSIYFLWLQQTRLKSIKVENNKPKYIGKYADESRRKRYSRFFLWGYIISSTFIVVFLILFLYSLSQIFTSGNTLINYVFNNMEEKKNFFIDLLLASIMCGIMFFYSSYLCLEAELTIRFAENLINNYKRNFINYKFNKASFKSRTLSPLIEPRFMAYLFKQ